MIDRELKDLFGKLSGNKMNMVVKYFDATVVSVDEDNGTCLVNSADGGQSFNNLKVRYMAELADGDENIPEIDSSVTILFTQITEPIIVSTSWLQRKTVTVGDSIFEILKDTIDLSVNNTKYNISDGSQKFNDGSFGGLVKVIELTSQINKLETDVNTLKTCLGSVLSLLSAAAVTPVPVLTPMMVTFFAPLAPYVASVITPTVRTQIENTKIKHGQ